MPADAIRKAILSQSMRLVYLTAVVIKEEELAKPDPDFDLEGATASSYGNHSFRQLADRCARDYRQLSGATEVEIDRMFGWNEAMYRRVMQLHYAGRHERVKRKMITGYM